MLRAAGPVLRLPLDAMEASEAAFREFHGRLRAFVVRRVGDPAAAEDIVQQVFLRLHRSLDTVRATDGLGGWLYRTARNAIADHHRAPARRRELPTGDGLDLDELPGPEADDDDGAAACAASCLRPLVERLPEPYRRAIELVELEGRTQRAAAEQEGISLPGMKARVQRGRRRLKALLLARCRLAVDARGGVVGCEANGTGGCRRS